jgi:hypothetical protein
MPGGNLDKKADEASTITNQAATPKPTKDSKKTRPSLGKITARLFRIIACSVLLHAA